MFPLHEHFSGFASSLHTLFLAIFHRISLDGLSSDRLLSFIGLPLLTRTHFSLKSHFERLEEIQESNSESFGTVTIDEKVD